MNFILLVVDLLRISYNVDFIVHLKFIKLRRINIVTASIRKNYFLDLNHSNLWELELIVKMYVYFSITTALKFYIRITNIDFAIEISSCYHIFI